MSQRKGWNWSEVDHHYWSTPSQESYYLSDLWKQKGFEEILDLGCGIGRHSIYFAEQGFKVTGYDLSETGLATLKSVNEAKQLGINVVHGDNHQLPFHNKSFDTVLAYHSIYHTDSKGIVKIINEVKRVLKDDGEFFLTMLSKKDSSFIDPSFELVDENTKMKLEQDQTVLPHYYMDSKEVPELLDGFDVIQIRQVQDLFDNKDSWHYFIHLKMSKN